MYGAVNLVQLSGSTRPVRCQIGEDIKAAVLFWATKTVVCP